MRYILFLFLLISCGKETKIITEIRDVDNKKDYYTIKYVAFSNAEICKHNVIGINQFDESERIPHFEGEAFDWYTELKINVPYYHEGRVGHQVAMDHIYGCMGGLTGQFYIDDTLFFEYTTFDSSDAGHFVGQFQDLLIEHNL